MYLLVRAGCWSGGPGGGRGRLPGTDCGRTQRLPLAEAWSRLLANPHLAHLDQPSPLSQGASAGPSSMPQLAAASGSYHSLSQGASPSPHPVLHTNTLPSRGGTSGLMQTHWATAGASSSQSSLSHSATAAYPVTSFRGQTSGTSQDSLEQQIASLAMNINNSNNNFDNNNKRPQNYYF